MKTTRLLILSISALFVCAGLSAQEQASPPPVTKDVCLGCHGPFDKLVKEGRKIPADPQEINPHVYIPHNAGPDGQYFDCLLCHQQHPFPPAQGYHDNGASLDPCISCHHNEVFKSCSSCHDKKDKEN